jgi:hypothetical protein
VAGQWPQSPLAGTVEEIARLDADDVPPHLAAAGVLPQTADEAGRPRSLQTIYQVRIAIDAPTNTLLPGTTGRALIAAPAETLATRLRRWFGATFRFAS